MPFFRIVFFFILFLASASLSAAENYYPSALRISSENGLSQNTIKALEEDDFGRIWVGTQDGLNLLNNNEIIVFRTDKEGLKLSGSEVNSLALADGHVLWVATDGGLDKIDTVSVKSHSVLLPKGYQSVSHLVVTAEGLYFISEQQLYLLKPTDERPSLVNSVPGNMVFATELNKQDLLLFSTSGFSLFNKNTGELIGLNLALPSGQVKAVKTTDSGVWISIKAQGLFFCSIESLQCLNYAKENSGLPSNNIAQIVLVNGRLYLATDNGIGIFNLSDKSWKVISPHDKNNAYQASQIARNLMLSDTGEIYVGTFNGLYRIPSEYLFIQALNVGMDNFSNASIDMTVSAVNGQEVLVVAEPSNLAFWALQEGRLTLVKRIPYPTGFEPSKLIADEGKLYITSLTSGSIQLDPLTGQFSALDETFPELGKEQLSGMDSFGSNIRVFHLERTMKVYKKYGELWKMAWQQSFPRGSAAARYFNGRLFVAAYQTGLMSAVMSEDWEAPAAWTVHQGLGIVINLEQQDSRLLVLTASKGIYQAISGEDYNITRLPVSDALNSQTLVCALTDPEGRTLLSGHKGISILDSKLNLQTNLTVLQGAHSQEFSQFSCGRFYNFLYFGSEEGLTLIRDSNIPQLARKKPQWTMLEFDNQQMNIGSETLTLRSPGYVKLHFVSSPSDLPLQAEFSYRILPLNNQWAELKSSFISFVNLRPGDYQVELRAKSVAGIFAPVTSARLHIQPRIWESPLAIALYIFFGLLVIATLVAAQIRAARAKLALQIEQNKRQLDYSRKLEAEVTMRTKELAQKKEEAIEANLAKTRFIAAASHDIKQPISLMRLQLEQFPNGAPRKRIGSSLNFLEQLVASVVELSRLDAKVVNPVYHTFSMKAFMTELTDEYGELASHEGVVLHCDIQTESSAYTDAVLLKRIIGNLIDNAIKISKSGDSVHVNAFNDGERLVVEVKDQGPGMSDVVQQGLFVPFRRWTNSYPGSGLGLSVVKGLADVLELTIDLESAPQAGTCFRLGIPLLVVPETAEFSRLSIALVEDDAGQRRQLHGLLESKGLEVEVFCGVEALLNSQRCYDVVLSDVNLSKGEDGIESAPKYAGKIHPGGMLIYISGNPEARHRVPKDQHIFFLAKPIKWGRLAWLLQDVNHRS